MKSSPLIEKLQVSAGAMLLPMIPPASQPTFAGLLGLSPEQLASANQLGTRLS